MKIGPASGSGSGHHNDRTRAVPNADPARTHLNRTLAGDGRNVREIVTESMNERGGRPRQDAVEAIELLCKTSPQFFAEKDLKKFQGKVERFCEHAIQFLGEERSGGKLVEEFGEKRAHGAYLVNREHSVLDLFERQRAGALSRL